MTYELAKQLKDAGYPQLGYSTEPRNPTLSELIEACGNQFVSLGRRNNPVLGSTCCAYSRDLRTDGRTYVEAVANLWLALRASTPTA